MWAKHANLNKQKRMRLQWGAFHPAGTVISPITSPLIPHVPA